MNKDKEAIDKTYFTTQGETMRNRETEGEKKRQNNFCLSHVVLLMLALIKYKSY